MSDPIKSILDKLQKLTPSTSHAIEELVQALADAMESVAGKVATLEILERAAASLEETDEYENDPLYKLVVADAAEAADMYGEDELEEYTKWVGRTVECVNSDDMAELIEGAKYVVRGYQIEKLGGLNLPPVAQFLITDETGEDQFYCCSRFEFAEPITHDDTEAELFQRRPRG